VSARYEGVIVSWGRDSDRGIIRCSDFDDEFPVHGYSLRSSEAGEHGKAGEYSAHNFGIGDRVSFVLAVADNGKIEARKVALVE
jgi:hypothetical protein